MARVIIIGGHGKVALLTAPLLVSYGHTVTSVVRNPDHESDVAATGANVETADVEHLDTAQLAELVSGYDVVMWSAGAGGGNPQRTIAVDQDAAIRTVDAAEQAGVPAFVMVSYYGARPEHGVPEDNPFSTYATAKAAADEHLRGSKLNWFILGPSALTDEEPTGRLEADIIRTEPGAALPKLSNVGTEISRGNVAQLAAAVIGELERAKPAMIVANDGETPIADVVAQLSPATGD